MEWIREDINTAGYEKVTYTEHKPSGMRSIIAIHNTNRGPACGGLRLLPYASKAEALEDVLRLSKGMSYKSAMAGIGFGGGQERLDRRSRQEDPPLSCRRLENSSSP